VSGSGAVHVSERGGASVLCVVGSAECRVARDASTDAPCDPGVYAPRSNVGVGAVGRPDLPSRSTAAAALSSWKFAAAACSPVAPAAQRGVRWPITGVSAALSSIEVLSRM
jgi:hypothetical protein